MSNPVSNAILMDDPVLVRILADFVEINKDQFAKFSLCDWAMISADAGRPRTLFLLFQTMHFMCHKLEVKNMIPYVSKCVQKALKSCHTSTGHYICAKTILHGQCAADLYGREDGLDGPDWDAVFSQAPAE